MTLQNHFYLEKETAGKALLILCEKDKSSNQKLIGEYRGFELHLSYDQFHSYHQLTLKKNGTYMIDLGNDVYGNITRIDNQINSISKKLETEKSLLITIEQQFHNAKEEVVRPFDKEQELQDKSSRLAILNKELDIGNQNNKETIPLEESSVIIQDKTINHER